MIDIANDPVEPQVCKYFLSRLLPLVIYCLWLLKLHNNELHRLSIDSSFRTFLYFVLPSPSLS